MDSGDSEITHNFPPYFKVYKDGRVERYRVFQSVDAGIDPTTGVQSKDVMISPETGVKARIFLPKINGPDQKLPLLDDEGNDGPQDPRMKPPAEDLARLGCERVLIFVAERDYLCPAGKNYYEELKKSGWKGRVELVEHLDEKHVFYLRNPTCTNALELTNKFISFIKQNNGSLRNSIESKY
ncbi:hypothetical protein WN944_028850 [Citrus x changshan-huyou]|uniref:Alpha/beta hydrolase fold-3 domain-containing protein n=1 Tax=Citrus x changshan-huyou TaxID=2935761 RepID=A0AAP0LKK6_9ROSI